MKARFVYESLNEDYQSFNELSDYVSNEVMKYIKEKDIDEFPFYKLFDDETEDEITDKDIIKATLSIHNFIDLGFKKYGKLKDFLALGIGLIFGSVKKNEFGDTGGFLKSKNYKDLFDNKEIAKKFFAKFPLGLIIFPDEELLIHELQHAYDDWRSGSKNNPEKNKYDTEKTIKKLQRGASQSDEVSDYYLNPSELSAYFTQAIKGHYWASVRREKFNKWDDQLYWFQKEFPPWHHLDEKGKKKYTNKFYTYYDKIKKIWEDEGEEGLKKRGLKYRK